MWSISDAVQCGHMKRKIMLPVLLLAIVAFACNAPGRGGSTQPARTPDELVRIPTLRAQQTELAQAATLFQDGEALATLQTPRAQQPQTTITPRSEEPAPISEGPLPTAQPPSDAAVAPSAGADGSSNPVPAGAAGLTSVGGYDGGDGYTTTLSVSIQPGQRITQTISTTVEAHNYTFTAVEGQSVVIIVDPDEFTDPRAKLITPTGGLLRTSDGGNQGGTITMELTLEEAGTYTIRVDIWPPAPGTYTISLQ